MLIDGRKEMAVVVVMLDFHLLGCTSRGLFVVVFVVYDRIARFPEVACQRVKSLEDISHGLCAEYPVI